MDKELFEVNTAALSEYIVKDLLPIIGLGTYPLNELMLMTATIYRLRPTHIIEWGTNIGKSARIFYETIKKFNIPSEIHSIDLPDNVNHSEHPREHMGKLVRDIAAVKLHLGDGLDTAIKIAEQISGECRLLFFVDGDHYYNSVYREISTLMTKFPEHNILAHDTFNQCSKSGYYTGPFMAIQDALVNIPNDFCVLDTNLGCPGMTLLYHLF